VGGYFMREGYEISINTLEAKQGEIEEGREVIIDVTDCSTWELKVVRAKVAKSLEDLPQAQQLWIRGRDRESKVLPDPWAIQVLEELDEDEVEGAGPQTFEPKK
jgi:hypothetical protein